MLLAVVLGSWAVLSVPIAFLVARLFANSRGAEGDFDAPAEPGSRTRVRH